MAVDGVLDSGNTAWQVQAQGRTMLMLVDLPAPLGPSNLHTIQALPTSTAIRQELPGTL